VTISLLYCGVDTLEATFTGELESGLAYRLHGLKARAQAADEPQSILIGQDELFVAAKGLGPYAYVLSDSDLQMRVSMALRSLPPVYVRLRAAALATHGHKALYERAARLAEALGAGTENTLSRIDLCADVQGWEFTDADLANLVCPASFRSRIEEGEGISYQIGKGDVVLRIYRKDAELKAKKNLAYAKVWERVSHYDPDLPVWRVEVQLRGSVLKELDARSVRAAFSKLPKLFFYGLSWCELRIPTDTNKSRWPLDPTWDILRGLWGASEPEPRVRIASKAESEERVVSRLTGALAALAAYCDTDDLEVVLDHARLACRGHMDARGQYFFELVEEKRARQIADQGVPF
jgi:hypothetical protein